MMNFERCGFFPTAAQDGSEPPPTKGTETKPKQAWMRLKEPKMRQTRPGTTIMSAPNSLSRWITTLNRLHVTAQQPVNSQQIAIEQERKIKYWERMVDFLVPN